jgi:hypothetical protein
MISAEHRAAMNAGRERQRAEAALFESHVHEAFHEWVVKDAHLWLDYLRAMSTDEGIAAARKAWHDNLALMPDLPSEREDS